MATTHKKLTEAEIRAVAASMLEAWNTHDIEAIVEHLHAEVVWTDPTLPEPVHGKDAVRKELKNNFTAFPDFHVTTEDFEVYADAENQTGVATWSFTGTMTGPLDIGVPATGRSVRMRGANQARYRDGLISEFTQYFDSYELMQQMGMVPKATGIAFKAIVLADVMAGRARKALQRH
ncbi:MAG: ester cyclase [Nocardioides sp.]